MTIKEVADNVRQDEKESENEQSTPAPVQPKPPLATLVLKPVHPPFYIGKNNCLPMAWTLPRNKVPPDLEARGVDLSTWNRTFARVRCLVRKNCWIEWMICPLFYTLVLAPCYILTHKAQEQGHKSAFSHLAEQEREVYGRYEIRVLVAIDNNIYGGQCDVDEMQFREYVSLHFILLEETKDETRAKTAAEVENEAMERW